MPKMKVKGAVKKRLKLTANGHVKRKKCNLRHLLTKKSSDRKRGLGGTTLVKPVDEPRMKRLLDGH